MLNRLLPTLSLWLLALLSFLNRGVLASGFLDDAKDCPGVFLPGDNETKYISAKDDLKPLDGVYNYSYTAYCHFSDKGDVEELRIDPATKILTEYHCDFGIVGGCRGYVVNPNYAFWDEGGKHFMEAPSCPLINDCDRTKDNCQDGTAACGGGEYICKPSKVIINANGAGGDWCLGSVVSNSEDAEPCPERPTSCDDLPGTCDCTLEDGARYSCHDDHKECSGRFAPTWDCPPEDVASFDEVLEYCPRECKDPFDGNFYGGECADDTFGKFYTCYFNNNVVCDGTYTGDPQIGKPAYVPPEEREKLGLDETRRYVPPEEREGGALQDEAPNFGWTDGSKEEKRATRRFVYVLALACLGLVGVLVTRRRMAVSATNSNNTSREHVAYEMSPTFGA